MKFSKYKVMELMAEKRMTWSSLAESSGVARQHISVIVDRGSCRIDTLGKIAAGLGVNVQEILASYSITDEVILGHIPYDERRKVYIKALAAWGDHAQMIVAIEELSECQKEICKILRGGENFPHLAEEIADATIMLEQLRLIFNINDDVNECMDAKIRRLEERLNGGNK